MRRLDEVFDIEYGNKLDMNKMTKVEPEYGIAFVGRIGGLNGKSGISGYVQPIASVQPYPAGLITVALGGSRLLSSYVQQRPFYTAQNVAVLSPRDTDMSVLHRLYYATCIRANAFRYSAFGREANRTLGSILVPVSPPTWVDSTAIPTHNGLTASVVNRVALRSRDTWYDFELADLFVIKKGKRVTKADRTPGSTPFIGATDRNNGVTDMTFLDPIFDPHSLTVPYNGSVGYAFYQDKPYFASDDVQVLVPRDEGVDKWAMLFAATMIRFEKDRFTYGYKWNLARMKTTTIKLPATDAGAPDWPYMSRYMQGLPYSAAIADPAPFEED